MLSPAEVIGLHIVTRCSRPQRQSQAIARMSGLCDVGAAIRRVIAHRMQTIAAEKQTASRLAGGAGASQAIKASGEFEMRAPDWGSEWATLTVGYPELEAALAK